jgi:tetratricopeptide (TPR) repeat protein
MKKMMKTSILTAALFSVLMLCGNAAFSQCKELKWPDNPELKAKAEESKVLYEDALKAGQFKHAEGPLNWLLKNAPNLHSSLYINGAEVFDKLASQEKDPARKKVYVDSLMIVYDMRIANCGDEANVMNRKAIAFMKFNANEQPAEALQMLDKAIELNGNNVLDASLVPYMQVVRLNVLKLKNLTDEQVLQRYDKLSGIIDAKIQKAQSENKPTDKLKKMKEDIDGILITIVKVDCEFVRKNLAPKFKQNPTDLDLAKKIFSFMLKDKCTDDPLWLEAGEAIHKLSPEKDCGLAKNLAIRYLSLENFQKAEELLKEAQGICTESTDKAEVILYLGSIEAHKGNKSGARELYRQAASADATVAKQAYEKIGDLYFNSFGECAKKVSQADDRLVYLIAYDYYQRSGDTKKMAMAKSAFPSKEEIFLVNYQAGSTKQVGCWINESTTVRTRD